MTTLEITTGLTAYALTTYALTTYLLAPWAIRQKIPHDKTLAGIIWLFSPIAIPISILADFIQIIETIITQTPTWIGRKILHNKTPSKPLDTKPLDP